MIVFTTHSRVQIFMAANLCFDGIAKAAEKMPSEGESDRAGDASKMVTKGTVLEEFKEVKEVQNIIKNIANIYGDQIAVEMALERYLGEWQSLGTSWIIRLNIAHDALTPKP